MSFNQCVILEYSRELFELLQEWEQSKIDISFCNFGIHIHVYYNDAAILFLLGRAYQNKTLITLANTKD